MLIKNILSKVFIIFLLNVVISSSEKIDNRELIEFLMQASSNAFSSLPPGYLFNANENQMDLSNNFNSSLNKLEIISSDDEDLLSNSTNNLTKTSYSKLLNLTKSLDEDEISLNNFQNKQSKNIYPSSMSQQIYKNKFNNNKIAGRSVSLDNWRNKDSFYSRTSNNFFNRPRKSSIGAESIRPLSLMASSADIPSVSAASYYTSSDVNNELEEPLTLAKSANTFKSYPYYNNPTNYGQYLAAAAAEVDPRQSHYFQSSAMRDYYDPHGHDLAYSKSDFYWLVPIAFLIGAGALLLPIISVFMTTLVTSGTLTLNAGRRRKRDVDVLVGELRHLIGDETYSKVEDLWLKLQKSIDKFKN